MFTGPNIITDGLVLYLDADNTKSYPGSGSTWNDLSVKNNTGTLINDPSFTNSNIILDGINDYIQVSNNLLTSINSNSSITVNIFVNINETALNTRGGLICNQRYLTEGDPSGFGFVIDNGIISVNLTKDIEGVKNSYQVLAGFPMNRQQYAYYTFTYNTDTKTVTTYKNGVLQTSVTDSNYGWTKNTTNRDTFIGINTQGGWGAYYKMNISQVSIYNKSLTPTEVLQNYNGIKSRFGL